MCSGRIQMPCIKEFVQYYFQAVVLRAGKRKARNQEKQANNEAQFYFWHDPGKFVIGICCKANTSIAKITILPDRKQRKMNNMKSYR